MRTRQGMKAMSASGLGPGSERAHIVLADVARAGAANRFSSRILTVSGSAWISPNP